MASEKQIAANRLNSEKCTGPRTEAGKTVSSQNALKTGLDAKSEVIRTEKPADYESLIAEYYARFHPTVPEERCLVDKLITSEWLGRRYLRADAAVWEQRFDDIKCEATGRVYRERSDIFARVERRINSAQRNFQQALKQLMAIQAKRAADPHPAEFPDDAPELGPVLVPDIASPEMPPLTDAPPPNDVTAEDLEHELVSFPISTEPLPPQPIPASQHRPLPAM